LKTRGIESLRTYEEINRKIENGEATVLTAEEFIEVVSKSGLKKAAEEVDVVTTGTFGAMCSSGAFVNFGHSEPPIKMNRVWLNDVEVSHPGAAVDAYIGATQMSISRPFEYGGGHVIEDLVSGKEIELKSEAYGTDCYPRKTIETTITLDTINQAILVNPRNAYERYNAATNSTDRILYTYMGTLLPDYGNVTFSGSGQLSPLYKDKNFETIGIGTRIFLGGGIGYVIGEGTQHNPQNQFGTIMVRGDLKQMNSKYLKGAAFYRYGTTLYVGIGIPIPIINMTVAESASLPDEKIFTQILDYGVPSRSRPVLKTVSYAELKSGNITINGKNVRSSPLSSFKVAKEIAETLKKQISKGNFLLNRPAELLPNYREFKSLEVKKPEPCVRDIMTTKVITAKLTDDITSVANMLVDLEIDHLPITDKQNKLMGIVTSWDLTKALAHNKRRLDEIMTKKVITAKSNESIDVIVQRMTHYNISGLPVVDEKNKVIGIITTDDISKKLVGRYVK
jgi:uncharacterized protein (DUF39 family)/predicted transcriptional regulator